MQEISKSDAFFYLAAGITGITTALIFGPSLVSELYDKGRRTVANYRFLRHLNSDVQADPEIGYSGLSQQARQAFNRCDVGDVIGAIGLQRAQTFYAEDMGLTDEEERARFSLVLSMAADPETKRMLEKLYKLSR